MTIEYEVTAEPRQLKESLTVIRSPHDPENPYFMMRRSTIRDAHLSYEARGLLAYLLSLKDGWQLKPEDLVLPGLCSRKKVYELLKELELAHHLKRPQKYQDEKGKWRWRGSYEVYEQPYSQWWNTVVGSEPYSENRNTVFGHTKDQDNVKEDTDQKNKRISASEKDDADARVETAEEASALEAKAESINMESSSQNEGGNVPPVTGAVQGDESPVPEKPKKNGKPERPVLPKAIQELIGKEVMGWQTMTDYHWKLVNAETLAKYLLPFNVSEDELRNFRGWYNKRYPTAPYTSPGILLSKLDLMRQDVKEGKFKIKTQTEPSNGKTGDISPSQGVDIKRVLALAEREGISGDEAYQRLYPNG